MKAPDARCFLVVFTCGEIAIAKQDKRNRLNDSITAVEVRLIGADGEQVGIVSIEDALRAAQTAGEDLVEIVPNAEPPVCRIMDYGKHVFEQKKQQQAARKKQKQVQIKEVKFRPATDIGDYKIKMRNLIKFLEQGNKVKVTMRFRGREHAHRELGLEFLQRVHRERQAGDPAVAIPYHYVIGNGNGLGMGEVASDWRKEYDIWGTHLSANNMSRNFLGLGVCLIGNFDESDVPAPQFDALVSLTKCLMREYGITPENVGFHGKIDGESTRCPGSRFPRGRFRAAIE